MITKSVIIAMLLFSATTTMPAHVPAPSGNLDAGVYVSYHPAPIIASPASVKLAESSSIASISLNAGKTHEQCTRESFERIYRRLNERFAKVQKIIYDECEALGT